MSLAYDDFATVIAQRKGIPIPNSRIDIFENEIFFGDENPFEYNRTYELEFNCGFELHKYPFDYQNCHIDVRKTSLSHIFL